MGPSPAQYEIGFAPTIPDYLIYDEIKRRREKEAWQPEQLEMPLYRPEIRHEQAGLEEESEPSDRGVFIIDMNDLVDEDEEGSSWEDSD